MAANFVALCVLPMLCVSGVNFGFVGCWLYGMFCVMVFHCVSSVSLSENCPVCSCPMVVAPYWMAYCRAIFACSEYLVLTSVPSSM